MRADSRRPHLGKRALYTYRCNYSRSVIHLCSFRRTLSLPMIDSVVWAYCQNAIMRVIHSESNKDINTRIAEIDEKIVNVSQKIQEFDIDSLIRAEEAILRQKTRMARNNESAIEKAFEEYNDRVEEIENELNEFKARKLELEEEKKAIKESKSIWGSINKDEIKSNKKLLYKHIHNIVNYIEIVGWDSTHLVLKIHFKTSFAYYKDNEYICIYSRTSKNISALLVHSYSEKLQELARRVMSEIDTEVNEETRNFIKRDFFERLPSTDDLYWDKTENKFKVNGFAFSLDEMMDYFKYPTFVINPLNPRLGATVAGAPVRIRRMEVERLMCYDEDIRD